MTTTFEDRLSSSTSHRLPALAAKCPRKAPRERSHGPLAESSQLLPTGRLPARRLGSCSMCWRLPGRRRQLLQQVVTTNLLGEANSQPVVNTTLTHLWFSKTAQFPTVPKSEKYAFLTQNPCGHPESPNGAWCCLGAASPASPRHPPGSTQGRT